MKALETRRLTEGASWIAILSLQRSDMSIENEMTDTRTPAERNVEAARRHESAAAIESQGNSVLG